MIELYTWTTPNGQKASIMLEEVGLPYRVHPIDIGKGQQFHPDFLAISPNSKIPAIIDTDNGLRLMESGAILLYLAEKTGKLWQQDFPAKWRGRVADVADGRARAVPRASSPLREVQSGKERIRRGALYQGSAQAVERARPTARRARIRGGRLFNCRYRYLALDFEIRVANRHVRRLSQCQALVRGDRGTAGGAKGVACAPP